MDFEEFWEVGLLRNDTLAPKETPCKLQAQVGSKLDTSERTEEVETQNLEQKQF